MQQSVSSREITLVNWIYPHIPNAYHRLKHTEHLIDLSLEHLDQKLEYLR